MSDQAPPPERGYGAIENITLRILFLVDPDREKDGREMSEAVKGRHEVSFFSGKGLMSRFSAARATEEVSPQLIHAVGLKGAAGAALPIGLAKDIPVIISLSDSDLAKHRRPAVRVAKQADAVVLDSREGADTLKGLGIEREVYVTSTPLGPHEARAFLGSIEIVYGRVCDRRGITAVEAPEVVQLGGLRKS